MVFIKTIGWLFYQQMVIWLEENYIGCQMSLNPSWTCKLIQKLRII